MLKTQRSRPGMETASSIAWLPPLISMHRIECCRVVSVVASIPRPPLPFGTMPIAPAPVSHESSCILDFALDVFLHWTIVLIFDRHQPLKVGTLELADHLGDPGDSLAEQNVDF